MISVFFVFFGLSMTAHAWAARAERMVSWVLFAGFAPMMTQRCHRATSHGVSTFLAGGIRSFSVLLDT